MKNDRNIFRLQCEPRTDVSEENDNQIIEYDARMRQEERKYSKLLAELEQTRWLSQPSSYKSNFDKNTKEVTPSEYETTRLTDDEIRCGCDLTMEQALLNDAKLPALGNDRCSNRSSTQHSIAFQYTLSMQEQNISSSYFNINKLTITIH